MYRIRCGVQSRSKPSATPAGSIGSASEGRSSASWPASLIVVSHLDPIANRGDDARDRLVDGHAVVLPTVAVPERDGTCLDVLPAGDQDEGDLLGARGTDLLAEPVVAVVQLGPHTGRTDREDRHPCRASRSR